MVSTGIIKLFFFYRGKELAHKYISSFRSASTAVGGGRGYTGMEGASNATSPQPTDLPTTSSARTVQRETPQRWTRII